MTDAEYFRARAERHRRLAEQAHHPAARLAHQQIAAVYESRAGRPADGSAEGG